MTTPPPFIKYEPLQAQVTRFASRVLETVEASIEAFLSRDDARAARVLENVNFEREVADEYRKALAVSFGAPPDDALRTLKLLVLLSRVGALAVGICRRTIDLGASDAPLARDALDRLATMVPGLLRDALATLAPHFVPSPNPPAVTGNDVFVDACHAQSFSELSLLVYQDARSIDRVRSLRAVARALEQIDDEAREIAGEIAAHFADAALATPS